MGKKEIIAGSLFAVFSGGIAALIAALQEPSSPFDVLLSYGGIAAILVGLCGLTLIYFYIQKEAPMSEVPSVTGSGTTVISHNQTGGVTAGTYINQAVLPEFRVVSSTNVTHQDGTHITTINAQIVSPFTPGNLHLDIHAIGLLNVNIIPPQNNGFSTLMMRNTSRNGDNYSTDIPTPQSHYTIQVHTHKKSLINLNSYF